MSRARPSKLAWALGGAAAGVCLVVACLDPTELRLRVLSTVPCDALEIAISTGDTTRPVATKRGCADASASPAYVGSLVVVPSGRDGAVTIEVMAGVGRSAQSCVDAFGQGCVIARRSVRQLAHRALTLPILIDARCDARFCDGTTTCVEGVCVPSVLDPTRCTDPTGCTPEPDGGVNGLDAGDAGPAAKPVHVAAGGDTTCALFSDGTVRCWGRDDLGQLGAPAGAPCANVACAKSPTVVPNVAGAIAISVGARHACAVTKTGDVWCWGDASSAQTGALGGVTPPSKVAGVASALAVGAGNRHTCAISTASKDAVVCWGANDRGQLGRGATSTPSPQPKTVAGTAAVGRVAAGDDFTCAQDTASSGEQWCWGAGDACQITQCSDAPAPVYGLIGGGGIALGARHGCMWKLWGAPTDTACWGDDAFGQLDGVPGPARGVGAALKVSAVAMGAGRRHTCAIQPNGIVRCWGDHAKGQCGVGATAFADTTLPSPPVELALGDAHTCALLQDASVWCWGDGALGQLGDGALVGRAVAVPVAW